MKPIRADQEIGLKFGTLMRGQARFRSRKIDRIDLLQQPDMHARIARAFGQKINQAGAVQKTVFVIRLVARQIKTRDAGLGLAVPKLDRLGARTSRRKRIPQPESMEHTRAVRGNLQTGPDFADRLGLFENRDIRPAQRQCPRHCQPCNASPQNGDLFSDQHFEVPPNENTGTLAAPALSCP